MEASPEVSRQKEADAVSRQRAADETESDAIVARATGAHQVVVVVEGVVVVEVVEVVVVVVVAVVVVAVVVRVLALVLVLLGLTRVRRRHRSCHGCALTINGGLIGLGLSVTPI